MGGLLFLKGDDPVCDASFVHGEDGDEIQLHNEHQQKQQMHTVCGERSLHRTWRTHGPRGGGGLEWLYIRQGILASTPFVTFK